MKVELENVKPMEIERRSFEIITAELKRELPAVSTQAPILITPITSAFQSMSWKKHWQR